MIIRRGKALFLLIMTCVMILSAVNVTSAESTTADKPIQNSISLGKVTLKDNITVDVNNLLITPIDNKQVIGLTLTVNNNSNSELDFLDYWIKLETKSGSSLNVQMAEQDSNKIPAKTTKDIMFYSNAGTNISLDDLVVKIIKWDFSATNYTRALGQISVPQRYNPVTPAGNRKAVKTGTIQPTISINQATFGKSEKYFRPDIRLNIENQGKSSVTLPDYQIYIQTSDNFLYPVTASNIKGTVLNALVDQEFQLTSSIPISAKEGNWKLVIMYPVNEGKDKVPVAILELPSTSSEVANDLNKYYSFTNSDGVYYVKLNSMNRLPIEDDDLVVANLTLANKGTETIPIPELTGKYVFNDKIETTISVSNNDKVIALQPNSTIDFQVVGRIPYTFDISKVNLVLQQKDSANSDVFDLVEFTSSDEFTDIQSVTGSEGFKIDDVGYRSQVSLRKLMTYTGTTADVLAAQITVKNEEKRLTDLRQLAGYFEKTDGTVYSATIQSIDEKLSPAGNALIYVWATIPKNTDVNDIKLVIGKALVESGSTNDTESKIVGYVSPYKFTLPKEYEAQSGLQEIDLMPYKLSIDRVRTQVNFKDMWLKLDFDYTLEQDLLTKANLEGQKIIIELEDNNQNVVFNKELALSTAKSNEGSESQLELGRNLMELTWTDDKLLNIKSTGDYTLKVYQEFQTGYRKLIAKETIPWLVNRVITE